VAAKVAIESSAAFAARSRRGFLGAGLKITKIYLTILAMHTAPVSAVRVAVRLRAATSALLRGLRADSAPGALAPAKWSVLAQLHRLGPLAPSELARHERVRLQTLTRLLAEIETAGLIVREIDDADGRRRVLSLTPSGRTLLGAEVHRREASLRSAVQKRLSPAERVALLDACALLDRVASALQP
jgi:DNA-binding MarR family transcriptional regulator